MKNEKTDRNKELYQQLRVLTCGQLWEGEVAAFDAAGPEERRGRVAVVRAVGVVFSESGTEEEREAARSWLRGLLHDPEEKVRRYAMAALPKLGAGAGEEAAMLTLLRGTDSERERKFLGRALEKIGGAATLEAVIGAGATGPEGVRTEQKVRANVARRERPGVVRMDRTLAHFGGLRVHLRGRDGLEKIVREEVETCARTKDKFRVTETRSGLVVLTPVAPFSLADIHALRCFGTVNFVLGATDLPDGPEATGALAGIIASQRARRLLETFTDGSLRYRLEFIGKGHQRGAVRLLAGEVFARSPDILNDPRGALWSVDIYPAGRGSTVELRPRLSPDPRFLYRRDDIPAASHPPLAACMARLAGPGPTGGDVVWDPFCGSGLELIERALLGGAREIHGTDLSQEAIDIVKLNVAAAGLKNVRTNFVCRDFHDFATVPGLGPDSVSLIVTNPPMGRRVRVDDLRGLIGDLLAVASVALRPGGRLVFANPLRMDDPPRALKLQSRQVVDLGGFDCRLEVYVKSR